MSDTPLTNAMLQPIDGRDCVTGEPISVVHADDCRALERLNSVLRNAVAFAQAAIGDAIYTEDGIDGDNGQRVLAILHEAVEHGTFDEKTESEILLQDPYSRLLAAQEELAERDALLAEVARLRSALSAAIKVADSWHDDCRGDPVPDECEVDGMKFASIRALAGGK